MSLKKNKQTTLKRKTPAKLGALHNAATNFLFATKANQYHPGILRAKSIGALIAVFLLYQLVMSFAYPEQRLAAADLTTGNITSAINRERQLRNLLTYNTHGALTAAAQSKADDMMARNYFSHTDPEGNYIWPKIVAAGYTPYLQLGENLAIEFYDTESLVAAWMNSPTHRANILNEGFRDQGMGLAFGNPKNNQYYSAIANTFGTLVQPKAAAPASQTTPQPSTPLKTTTPKSQTQIKVEDNKPKTTTTPATAPTSTTASKQPSKIIAIQEDSLKIATTVKGSALVISLAVEVGGPPDTVIAAIGDRTILLNKDASASNEKQATYQGTIELSGDQQISSLSLKVLAQDSQGSSDTAEFPLLAYGLQMPTSGSTLDNVPTSKTASGPNPYKTSRTITVAFGLAILTLLVSDTWVILEKKFHLVDKKLNNAFVLFIAIVVAALIYFM